MENQVPDPNVLKELLTYKMPFGKYKGRLIIDLPAYYLEWFASKGFPDGKLGMLLSTAHVIKLNGLDGLIKNLRKK